MILPAGITSSGWPAVRDTAARMGVAFDQWQAGLGKVILAKRADGQYAAGVGGIFISIGRQVGKTFTIGTIIVALCLLNPGTKVVWTSHHDRTTRGTFKSLVAITKRRRIFPHILAIRQANGQREIEFLNGSVIMFGARGSGFGRGDDAVDILVFDEAQILTQRAMDDMVPTMNVAPNPLLILLGTPPTPHDPSEIFKGRRREALSGTSDDLAYVEFSADRDAELGDREQWRKANPSFPHRTSERAIQRVWKNLGDESFRREGLGIWDEDQAGSRLISEAMWEKTGVPEAPEGVKSFGVAYSLDGSRVAIAGARKHEHGVHVEILGIHTGSTEQGVGPLADWLTARWRETARITISGRAGASVLHAALRTRKVPAAVLHVATTAEYTTACATLLDGVRDRSVTHLAHEGQQVLDDSVAISDKKARGNDGAWGFQATTPEGDETPTEAISLALWGAKTTRRKPGGRQKLL